MAAPGFHFRLPVVFKKRSKWYVAACPVLDIASQGTSKRKALSNLKEAISLFLSDCYERGTLEKVLKLSGFTPARGHG